MKNKTAIGIIIVLALMLCMVITIIMQDIKIEHLTAERDRYKSNTETLLTDCRTYQVRDSLSAARVGSLELTVKELQTYRSADARLISDLVARGRDLETVNKAQAQTIISLQSIPRDTVILVDSIPVQAKSVHCGDAWYDFDGIITDDSFDGTLRNRESLLLTETVRYKRFLFWKTKRIRDRQLDAVSLNPHTTITGLEHIIIDQ